MVSRAYERRRAKCLPRRLGTAMMRELQAVAPRGAPDPALRLTVAKERDVADRAKERLALT
jgi:hypothetical protein